MTTDCLNSMLSCLYCMEVETLFQHSVADSDLKVAAIIVSVFKELVLVSEKACRVAASSSYSWRILRSFQASWIYTWQCILKDT